MVSHFKSHFGHWSNEWIYNILLKTLAIMDKSNKYGYSCLTHFEVCFTVYTVQVIYYDK